MKNLSKLYSSLKLSKMWFKKHPKTKINFTIFVFNTIYTAFKTTFTRFLKLSSYHFIMNSWLCTTYLLKETILTNKMHLEGLISILATYFSRRKGVHADIQCGFEEATAMTTNHFSFSQIICLRGSKLLCQHGGSETVFQQYCINFLSKYTMKTVSLRVLWSPLN